MNRKGFPFSRVFSLCGRRSLRSLAYGQLVGGVFGVEFDLGGVCGGYAELRGCVARVDGGRQHRLLVGARRLCGRSARHVWLF